MGSCYPSYINNPEEIKNEPLFSVYYRTPDKLLSDMGDIEVLLGMGSGEIV